MGLGEASLFLYKKTWEKFSNGGVRNLPKKIPIVIWKFLNPRGVVSIFQKCLAHNKGCDKQRKGHENDLWGYKTELLNLRLSQLAPKQISHRVAP